MRDTTTKDRQYSGLFTHLTAGGTMTEYYTTVTSDEIIRFTESDGTQRFLDATIVENCGESVLYVLPLNGTHPLPISARESYMIKPLVITGIQVIGAAGQKLRYSGCYY